MSLLGALTPLGKAAPSSWLRSTAAYTAAGGVSASSVGALLGLFGRTVCDRTVLYLIVPLALGLAAREWNVIHFGIPECKRQTKKIWAHEFGFGLASMLWGFHIGLGFATRITYGGFFVLVGLAFGMGDPAYGSVLFLVYWLGRVLPVWLSPKLIYREQNAEEFIRALIGSRGMNRHFEGFALLWVAGVVGLSMLHRLLLGH